MISLLKARERILSPIVGSSIRRYLSSSLSYARDSQVFIHPSAVVHPSAVIGKDIPNKAELESASAELARYRALEAVVASYLGDRPKVQSAMRDLSEVGARLQVLDELEAGGVAIPEETRCEFEKDEAECRSELENLRPSQIPSIEPAMISLLKARERILSPVVSSYIRRYLASSLSYARDSQVFIHPSAVVHPSAVIGKGVSVGPYCTVGSSVKLGDGCKLYPSSHILGNTELGESCVLMTGAVVGDELPGYTVIGCNNIIGHHAVVGVKCQDLKYKHGDECFLCIGNNNEIREFCSIHRSSKSSDRTVIGDNNLIMGSCHIAHDCNIGDHNIFANNTLLAGHVIVQDYTHTAGATVIHQFCHIGSYAFIGGGSVVSQDVPKYMMVTGERAQLRGLNLEGLRRNGFTMSEMQSLRAAYRKIFMSTETLPLSLEERLTMMEQDQELYSVPAVSAMLQSIRDSFAEGRRGICKFRQWLDS